MISVLDRFDKKNIQGIGAIITEKVAFWMDEGGYFFCFWFLVVSDLCVGLFHSKSEYGTLLNDQDQGLRQRKFTILSGKPIPFHRYTDRVQNRMETTKSRFFMA